MGFSFILALVLLGVLIVGVLASVLVPGPLAAARSPIRGGLPPAVVAACTLPVAALVFYLAGGYAVLEQMLPHSGIDLIFVALHVVTPLAAGGVCAVYYVKSIRRLRFFLLLWVMLGLALVGASAWGLGLM